MRHNLSLAMVAFSFVVFSAGCSKPKEIAKEDLQKQVAKNKTGLDVVATPAELCRKHNIKPQLLTAWKDAVIERMHTLFE